MGLVTKVNQSIYQAKRRLTKKAKKDGLWENFGQDEVYKLKDKFDYSFIVYGTPEERKAANQIKAFDDWCMNFTLNSISHV